MEHSAALMVFLVSVSSGESGYMSEIPLGDSWNWQVVGEGVIEHHKAPDFLPKQTKSQR